MENNRQKVRPFVAGLSLFLLLQYALGISRLVNSSDDMDNKFNALAREQHFLFLLQKNLYVGVAYILLGIAAFVVLWPLWEKLEPRFRPHRLWSTLRAFLMVVLVHGYFVIRLSATRPYFLQEAEYGQWYYHLCDWFPRWLNALVFSWFPYAALLAVSVWYWRRWQHKPRTRWLTAVLLLTLVGIWTIPKLTPAPVAAKQAFNPTQGPWNVLIIGSDSLRGDRLGFTGYKPARSDGAAAAGVSPSIDALASKSQVFARCYTPIASTLESNTSLHTSLYPHSHGFRQMYPNQQQVEKTTASIQPIATQLRQVGYHTAAIGDWCAGFYEMMPLGHEEVSVSSFDSFKIYMSQAVIMAHFIVPLYFDHEVGFQVFPEIESFAQFVTPEVVTKRVENKLAEVARSGQPFFSHVFYSCNHLPYRSVQPYNSLFADPNYRGKNKTSVDFDIDEFIGGTDLENKWNKLTPADAQQISALYDGCTRQFDDCVARILEALKRNGLAERTIVIISSDHGDDLYEPGATLGHGLSFNGGDQSNHIPLVMYVPGKAPQTFQQIVRAIDIAPTLMDLLGQSSPAGWEGKSFAPWLDEPSIAQSRPFYAETGFPFIQLRVENVPRPPLPPMDEMTFIDDDYDYHFVLKPEYEQRLVDAKERVLRTEHWKLILTPCADGERHFRLFDLRNDPHCEHNIVTEKPEVFLAMKKALEKWVDEKTESDIATIFPAGEP
jgi:arylsulfatase A-like enzyme